MMKAKKIAGGFSLVEVLVALVVLSIGLLALAGLQLKSVQFAHSSYQRSVAVSQANDLIERIWAGVCVAPDSNNGICGSGSICADWQAEHNNTPGMPGWNGILELDDPGPPLRYRIQISWSDPRFDPDNFEYFAVIPVLTCD